MSARFLSLSAALVAASAGAQSENLRTLTEPPHNMFVEFKLGPYKPLVDRESSLTGQPYQEIFGGSSMLLFELELDFILWEKFGSLALGFSAGYSSKSASALIVGGPNAGQPANDSTSLRVVPLRILGVYRLDYPVTQWNIPFVPYGKVGLVAEPWWASKGGSVENVNGANGSGTKFGWCFMGGLALMLDFLEPRMAKDFTVDVGVAHSYIFAEYVFENVNTFGKRGLDLSSRHFMYGLSLEF